MKWSKNTKCRRCKKKFTEYPAISRRDNETEICSFCGVSEALFDFQCYEWNRIGRTPKFINEKKEEEKKWI